MKRLFLELDKLQDAIYNDGFIYGLVLGSMISLATLAILHTFFADRKEKNQ
jgi:hypothetical protein